jgi:hypothetical protein
MVSLAEGFSMCAPYTRVEDLDVALACVKICAQAELTRRLTVHSGTGLFLGEESYHGKICERGALAPDSTLRAFGSCDARRHPKLANSLGSAGTVFVRGRYDGWQTSA